ncbi:MAG: ATP-binding protein [Nostoc sp. DedSLP03]|uniref:ATP-binding protein n=1 Tax=Nostoc sp. DedSLP03 TaxID=3075400 RepID=UPI002AD511EA|nr:ATP-binding protein [Nostoc sp. DedSLP03]MDZ7967369.1 ATP-binding protein [Nostoc sp. DedSLP03]
MQRLQRETVTLEDIVITEELSRRNSRPVNLLSENQALHTLARQLVNQPETMLQSLVDMALELCNAQSTGVSLLELLPSGEEVFRWNVLAGTSKQYVGGTTPRNFSPCGTCLDRGTPELFSHPERYFTYFQEAKMPFVEGLVLPLIADNQALGTIWIISHDEQRHFDREDVRVMTSLADLTAATLLLNRRQTKELLAANTTLEAEIVERKQAQEQSRALIENLPGGAAFVVDRDLRYLLAEGEALSAAGFKSEDFVGKTIFEVLPPELAANYEVFYRRGLAGESFEHEHDAHNRSFISRGTPLRSGDGEVYAVLAVSYDISDRKQAEAAVRESEQKYRSLFENVNDGFCIIEMLYDDGQPVDFRFLEVNPAFETHSGFKHPVGKTARDFTPDLQAEVLTHYQNVLATGKPIEFEIQPTGVEQYFQIAAYRYGDPQNKQLAIVFSDITDRKRAEETQAFLLKLSDSLRSLSDPVTVQETAMQVLGTHMSVNRAFYGEVLDDNDTLVIGPGYANELSSLTGQIKFSEFDSDLLTAYRAGQTVVINDLYLDVELSAQAKAAFDAIQVQAAVGVALVKNEKVRAILSIHQSVPRQWTQAEIALLKETAERTWAAVERARAETALRESEIERVRESAAREQERQRAESLAELDRAKTLFFSNVSHEFRTPLTLLLAPLSDALSDSANPLPQEQQKRLEIAHRNSLRLLKLVNTLLDFSRIEAGRMEAVYKPTDLALYTTELASVFRSAIERAGLRLAVDCPSLPEPVYVDREMWEKIVLNLLSNAFKFTFEGEIAVRLHLADERHVTLQVEDTGFGIEPEELPHLFERFYQVRRTKARTHEGSGIGLALVQELIKLHGGTIDVSSTVGQGSCFTVTLLLGTAHLPSVSVAGRDSARRLRLDVGDPIATTRTLASTALGAAPYVREAERWIVEEGEREKGKGEKDFSLPSPLPLTLSPSRVLIVDDNADMRDYLKRILSEHDVEVEAVADGAAALAAITERVPSLVLSDVMMPLLDGFELLKALRGDTQTKEVPIILLSARAGEESVIEGLLAGADDYLIKPFSTTELVTRVLAHLQMTQLRSVALHQEKTINRMKDKFLAEVSHELNTPLVAILGWTRLLRSSPPSQAMLTKSLETIERNATLQAKLVQDLLDISRITAGKISLNLEPVELQEVIEAAIATVHQSYQTKDIRLECTLAPLPVIVQGDPDRLQQILLNLLTNAVKFTPTGGRIEISLQTHENQAQIILTDTGCGINSEFLPHIFDAFRQAKGTKKGLGLGLAIARNLVELHGGIIYAQSAGVGQGATFIVNLPLSGNSI